MYKNRGNLLEHPQLWRNKLEKKMFCPNNSENYEVQK